DLSALPGSRVLVLARYGLSAKAPLLRQLAESRRTATLVATVRHLEQKAIDDALDLFAMLMQTKLLARAERESAKEQLRTLRRFAAPRRSWPQPSRCCSTLALERGVSLADVWTEIELVVPRSQVAAAL